MTSIRASDTNLQRNRPAAPISRPETPLQGRSVTPRARVLTSTRSAPVRARPLARIPGTVPACPVKPPDLPDPSAPFVSRPPSARILRLEALPCPRRKAAPGQALDPRPPF
ncbi:hypothetical protein GCM10028864_49510 [Microlunatus parietis]